MIDGKPDYTRLSTLAMADVVMLGEADRLIFVNALCEMYENIGKSEYKPQERTGFIGRAIKRQFAEYCKGLAVYMRNVNSNPSGGKATPVGTPVPTPVGTPVPTPTRTRTEQEKEQETEQRQNKSPLSAEEYLSLTKAGYSPIEISAAEAEVEDWTKIRNKPGYIRGTIDNKRNRRSVSAQDYSQREYDEPEESPEEMLERYKKELNNE